MRGAVNAQHHRSTTGIPFPISIQLTLADCDHRVPSSSRSCGQQVGASVSGGDFEDFFEFFERSVRDSGG